MKKYYQEKVKNVLNKVKTENGIKSQISYRNKIIIHKELNDTLNEYITKGKDNFMFEELFDEDEIKNNKNLIEKTDLKNNYNINNNNK